MLSCLEIIDSEVIDLKIDVEIDKKFCTDVPDNILLLMQTGSIYGDKFL